MIKPLIEQLLFYVNNEEFISLTVGYSGTTFVNGEMVSDSYKEVRFLNGEHAETHILYQTLNDSVNIFDFISREIPYD